MSQTKIQLVQPTMARLPQFVEALQRGWSPNNERPEAGAEMLQQIAEDADAFLALTDNRAGGGLPVNMPDGTQVERLPSISRWMWTEHGDDAGFAGTIQLRWQQGTATLPPYCLGHIGYGVVPWKQRRGCASQALALILPEARALGLPYVEITTDPHNLASQKVIESNGGVLFEHFVKPPQFGSKPALRYRIQLLSS